MIANSPPLISACSESGNMVDDSSESDALKHNPHTHTLKTHPHTEVEAELYMTFPPIMDRVDCQFLKEIKMTLIVFI